MEYKEGVIEDLRYAAEDLRREDRERETGMGGKKVEGGAGTTVSAEIAPIPRGEDCSPPYDSLGGRRSHSKGRRVRARLGTHVTL